jgi:hypothetical protein
MGQLDLSPEAGGGAHMCGGKAGRTRLPIVNRIFLSTQTFRNTARYYGSDMSSVPEPVAVGRVIRELVTLTPH